MAKKETLESLRAKKAKLKLQLAKAKSKATKEKVKVSLSKVENKIDRLELKHVGQLLIILVDRLHKNKNNPGRSFEEALRK